MKGSVRPAGRSGTGGPADGTRRAKAVGASGAPGASGTSVYKKYQPAPDRQHAAASSSMQLPAAAAQEAPEATEAVDDPIAGSEAMHNPQHSAGAAAAAAAIAVAMGAPPAAAVAAPPGAATADAAGVAAGPPRELPGSTKGAGMLTFSNDLFEDGGDLQRALRFLQAQLRQMQEQQKQQQAQQQIELQRLRLEHQTELKAVEQRTQADLRAAQSKADRLEASLKEAQEQLAAAKTVRENHQHWFATLGITMGCEAARLAHQVGLGAEAHIELGQLKEQVAAANSKVQDAEQQLELQARSMGSLHTKVDRLNSKQPQQCVVYAPVEATSEQLAQDVARAAKIPCAGLQVRLVHRPREAGAAASGGAAATRAAGAAEPGGAAAAASDEAAADGEMPAAGRAARRRLGVWIITASPGDVRRILSGGTRMALKRAGLPLYVDDFLTPEQCQQRKRLQALRRQLWAQRIRTRWNKAELQQRVRDEQGRWTWQRADYPAAPVEGEVEEGEVTAAGGSGTQGGVDAAA